MTKLFDHVAIITEAAFNVRDYHRFGAEFLTGLGVEVTVLDVADVTRPHFPHDRSGYASLPTGWRLRVIRDQKALAAESVLKQADLVLMFAGNCGVSATNLPLFRAVSSVRAPYVVFLNNAYPGWNRMRGEKGKRLRRLMDIVGRGAGGRINPLNSLIARIPHGWLGVREPDFVVYGGTHSKFADVLSGGATKVIWAHSNDFEIARSLTCELPKPQAVFIDEFLPYDPDLVDVGAPAAMPPELYYPCLCRAFDRVEAELGLQVVIAASPRADYSGKGDPFVGRRIVQGQTGHLVAESRLVLGHRSTALQFAPFFGKPLVQLVTPELLRDAVHGGPIASYRGMLNLKQAYFNDVAAMDLTGWLDYDAGAYADFMEKYVKVPWSPRAGLWDIVFGAIKDSGRLSATAQ